MMEWPNIVGQGMKVVIAGVGLGLAGAFALIGAGSADQPSENNCRRSGNLCKAGA